VVRPHIDFKKLYLKKKKKKHEQPQQKPWQLKAFIREYTYEMFIRKFINFQK
jgi:hypothetical protein